MQQKQLVNQDSLRVDKSDRRILLSAWLYNERTVSEGWTAFQMVAALRRMGWRMTVLTAYAPHKPKWYGVAAVRCRVPIQTIGWAPNYIEYCVRSLVIARRIQQHYSLVHQATPITLRTPSTMGFLDLPFLWGPVGGCIPYPPGFEAYSRNLTFTNMLRSMDRLRVARDPTMLCTMRKADRIAVTTSMAADVIPDRFREKVVVVPEGLPDEYVLPLPENEEPFILCSGRLVPYKAIDIAVRAYARLRGAESVKLIITGDGPSRNEVAALIEKLNLSDRVKLRGRVSREENQRLMRRALFCAFPALREAFGHVYLEAMAAWRPVVATDWGGPRDIVLHGETGFKVLGRNPSEHVELFADAMQKMLDDTDARRAMGAAAARRVQSVFSWSILSGRYDRIYRSMLA